MWLTTRCVVRGAWHSLAQDGLTSPLARAGALKYHAPHTTHLRLGFTLIELLVVITVIAVLAGLVGPMVFRNVGDAKVSAAKAQIELFGLALDAYRLDNDYYPTTAQGLEALRTQPSTEPQVRNWRGPYVRKGIPLDPWGRPYVYKSPGEVNGESFDLVSYGRDGQLGGTGEDADVTSWGTGEGGRGKSTT